MHRDPPLVSRLPEEREPHDPGLLGGNVLFVHGGPATAVVRGPAGESVVLLSGELPEVLTEEALTGLLDLAAAILDAEELELFHTCLRTLRTDGLRAGRRIAVDGAVLTVYEG